MKILTPLLLLALAWPTAQASTLDFTFQPQAGAELGWWGTGKKDTYDVAVRLQAPALVGKTVTGLRVPVTAPSAASASAWLSTALNLKKVGSKKVNDPDVLSQEATLADGFLDVTFSQPYTITDQGVYVGYTVETTVATDEADQHPIATYQGVNPDGFYIHTMRQFTSWADQSQGAGAVSAMTVRIDGMEPLAVSPTAVLTDRALVHEPVVLQMDIANHGTEPVTAIAYTYAVGEASGSGEVEFDAPLQPLFNAPVSLELALPGFSQTGTLAGQVAITGVNGSDNADPQPAREFSLAVMPFMPVKRNVVEEYTGLWCANCPIGLACMERMAAEYGQDFIGISYHYDDIMEVAGSIPSYVEGYPISFIDRWVNKYPQYSILQPAWAQMQGEFTPADISAEAAWTDDSHTTIQASSTTRFAVAQKASDYRLVYILTENGLGSQGRPATENWLQKNDFSGKENTENDPYMEQFFQGPALMGDLTFNDVAVHAPDNTGIRGVIPANIDTGQEISHGITIAADDVVNVATPPLNLIFHPDRLSLVVMLLDAKTGRVANANRCAVAEPSGVGHVDADRGEAVYYDLTGRRVDHPAHGLFIRVSRGRAVKVRL